MTLTLGAMGEALCALAQAAVPGAVVRLGPPAQASGPAVEIAVWLYQVEPDAALRNQQLPGRGTDRSPPPLALRCAYLLSPAARDTRAAQDALGALVAAIHAQPLLHAANGATLQATLEPLPLERLTALWGTLAGLPLQASVAVLVRG
jgi:hypothetical protein